MSVRDLRSVEGRDRDSTIKPFLETDVSCFGILQVFRNFAIPLRILAGITSRLLSCGPSGQGKKYLNARQR